MLKKLGLFIFSFLLLLGLVVANPVFAEDGDNGNAEDPVTEPAGNRSEEVCGLEPEGEPKSGTHMHNGIEYTRITSLEQIVGSGHYYLDYNEGQTVINFTGISNRGDVVLCLNGKTLNSGSGNKTISDTNLTIEDSHSGDEVGHINNGGYIEFNGNKTLTINNGVLTATNGNATALHITNGARVVVNGGTINGNWHGINLENATELTITGGKIAAVHNPINSKSNTTIKISAGEFVSDYECALGIESGSPAINISGGTFETKANATAIRHASTSLASITITGGVFKSQYTGIYVMDGKTAEINISGGEFNTGNTCVFVANGGNAKVSISGGTSLSTTGNYAVDIGSGESTLNISGGKIEAESTTVRFNGAFASFSGGTVEAKGANAVEIQNGTVSFSGGKFITNRSGENTGVIFQAGGTVTLNSGFDLSCNLNCDGYFVNSANAVLNINGASISSTGSEKSALTILNASEVNINNGTIAGGNPNNINNTQAIYIRNGTLNVKGGTIKNVCGTSENVSEKTDQTIAAIKMADVDGSNPIVNISGGIVSCKTRDVICVKAGVLNVTGGQIAHDLDGVPSEYKVERVAIDVFKGTANITGGTIDSEYIALKTNGADSSIVIGSASTNISSKVGAISNNGGTITINSVGSVNGPEYAINNSSGTITIEKGSFSSNNLVVDNKGTMTINGGSFTSNASNSVGILNSGSLTVSGSPSVSGVSYGLLIKDNGTATLSGGSYSCVTGSPVKTEVTYHVTGNYLATNYSYHKSYKLSDGTFNSDVAELNISEGKTAYVLKDCQHESWDVNDAQNIGICRECQAELVRLYGTQLSVGNNLEMTFYLQSHLNESDVNNWSVEFTRDHSPNDQTILIEPEVKIDENDSSMILFTYKGINPQCMTTPVTATITYKKAGDEPKILIGEDTVQNYCARRAAVSDNTDELKMMASLLNYGAAVQEYRGWYNSGDKRSMANEGSNVSRLMEYLNTKINPPVIPDDYTTKTRNDSTSVWDITGVTLKLDYQTSLYLRVKGPGSDGSSAVLSVYNDNDCVASKEIRNVEEVYEEFPVSPLDFDKIYRVELAKDSSPYTTVNYGVNIYCAKNWGKAGNQGEVVRRLYMFGYEAQELAKNKMRNSGDAQ